MERERERERGRAGQTESDIARPREIERARHPPTIIDSFLRELSLILVFSKFTKYMRSAFCSNL